MNYALRSVISVNPQASCAFLVPIFSPADPLNNAAYCQELDATGAIESFIPFDSEIYTALPEPLPPLERQCGDPGLVAFRSPDTGVVIASYDEALAALAATRFTDHPFFELEVAYLLCDSGRYRDAAWRAARSLGWSVNAEAWREAHLVVSLSRIAARKAEAERLSLEIEPDDGPASAAQVQNGELLSDDAWRERIEELIRSLRDAKGSTAALVILDRLARLRTTSALKIEALRRVALEDFEPAIRIAAVDALASRVRDVRRFDALVDIAANVAGAGEVATRSRAMTLVEARASRIRSPTMSALRTLTGIPLSRAADFEAFSLEKPLYFRAFREVLREDESFSWGSIELLSLIQDLAPKVTTLDREGLPQGLVQAVMSKHKLLAEDLPGRRALGLVASIEAMRGSKGALERAIAANAVLDQNCARFLTEWAIVSRKLAPPLVRWLATTADETTSRTIAEVVGRMPSGMAEFIAELAAVKAAGPTEHPAVVLERVKARLTGVPRNLAERLRYLMDERA